jgi:fructose-bisphosphate aldolase, class II
MLKLKQILKNASDGGWAVPHFNTSDLEILKAITEACAEKRSPVLVGTSEGERKFIGLEQAVALIVSYRKEYDMPFYLNADHSHSVDVAKQAIDAGYDSVHIDLSKKSYEENTAGSREVVEYAKKKNAEISVEGEIGYIVTDSSKIYKSAVEVPDESLASPKQAKEFVELTGVDRLAPAVGTLHGIAANEPHIRTQLIEKIHSLLPDTALVLHGGSGAPHGQIKEAVRAGIANVHISTDIRVTFVNTLRKELDEDKDEYSPYKLMKPGVAEVKKLILFYIDLFGSAGKA